MNIQDDGFNEFCSTCIIASTDCVTGFEKLVDFENVGVVIYRRFGKPKNVIRNKNERIVSATKTVIIHNTSDMDVTSDDFFREMQTRKITCPRCQQIIELARKLLQKVPTINKKAVMGICDHCKLKDPCHECKETTKSFLNQYDAKPNEEQITDRQSKMENVTKDYFMDKKTRKKHKDSGSEQRIEKLLHREYVKAERELEIIDLFRRSQTLRSIKSLPVIKKDKKHFKLETVNQTPIIKPSSDSKMFIEPRPVLKIQKSKYYKDDDIFPEHPRPHAHEKEKYDQKNIDDQHLETIEKKYTDDEKNIVHLPSDESSEFTEKHPISKRGIDLIPKFYEMETTQKEFSFSFYQDKIKPEREHLRQKTSLELIQETQDMMQNKSYEIKRQIIENRLQKEEEQERKRLDLEEKARLIAEKKLEAERTKYIQEEMKLMKTIEIGLIKEALQNEKKNSLIEVKLTTGIKNKFQEDQFFSKFKPKDLKSELNRENPISKHEHKKNQPDGKKDTKYLKELKNNKQTKLGDNKQKQLDDNKQKHLDDNKQKQLEVKKQKHLYDNQQKQLDDDKQKKLEDNKQKELKTQKLKELENIHEKGLENKKTKEFESKNLKESENKGLKQLQNIKPKEVENKKQKEEKKIMKDLDTKKPNANQKNQQKEKDKKQLSDDNEHLKVIEDSDEKPKERKKKDKKDNENKGVQSLKKKQDIGLGNIKPKNIFNSQQPRIPARMQKIDEDDKKTTTTISSPKSADKNKKQDKTNVIQDKTNVKQDNANVDLRCDKIKIRPHKGDLIFVKFKEGSIGPRYTYKGKTLREHLELHQKYHKVLQDPSCPFCLHSELELNVDLRKQQQISSECIKGKNIVDINALTEADEYGKKPMLFHTNYDIPVFDIGDNEKILDSKMERPKTADKGQSAASGVIRYVLSDRAFIEKGWTVLPTEKVMRKMNVYRMRPAKPEFDWFKRNKDKQQMFYDSGERFTEFQDDGRCRWYYKNKRLALDYYNAAELNAQQRFVIYSNGEPDERGRARPYTILATFDHLGNGVVFDHGGKIRLKYNQTEGVVLDRSIGPVSHWKWHTLNDPPVLQQVMIDTQLAHKDPNILKMGEKEDLIHDNSDNDNEEMMAIEFDNFVKEKSQKLTQNFKPFQIKMKALKINENFSLKVLDQANVYLIYRDGTTNIKVNIGMLLDHKEIIDTDTAEVGDVANSLERLPARTESLEAMQKSVAYAQHFEKTQTEHELRLRPPEPSASADKMTAAVSRPLRPPLRTFNSSITTTTQSTKPFRRPPPNNIYYSTI